MANTTARTTSVQLPDELVKRVASELKIKDASRIPTKLVFSTIDENAAKSVGLAARPGVSHIGVVA